MVVDNDAGWPPATTSGKPLSPYTPAPKSCTPNAGVVTFTVFAVVVGGAVTAGAAPPPSTSAKFTTEAATPDSTRTKMAVVKLAPGARTPSVHVTVEEPTAAVQ